MARLTPTVTVAISWCVLGALASITRPDPVAIQADDAGDDASLMAEHQVEPTHQGVLAFLDQLKRELAEVKKAEALIPQLGDDTFRVREAAVQQLIEGPSLPVKALHQATRADDPEITARASQILRDPRVAAKLARAESRPWISAAVFRFIQKKRMHGVTPALFDVIPLLEDADLLDLACETVAEIASIDDAPLLARSRARKNIHMRIAAIRGLARADVNAEAALRTTMDDADPRLALAAAHTLAQRGDRAALSVLVRLASAKDERVRVRSEQILRAWTGRHFGFDPFQDPAAQEKNLARWRQWIATEGPTARLNTPLRLAHLPEEQRQGLLLHYTFEQAVDRQLNDGSGHRRHGTIHNAHVLVSGIAGKALEVRGSGEMGDQGGHASLPFIDFATMEQFTLALWVYERGMSDDHGEAYVVFGADRAVGLEDSLGISHFNNVVVYRVGGALVQTRFDKADRNRWVHYCLTFQDGRLRAFKDGRRVGDARGRVVIVGKQAAIGRHWWHHGAATSTRFIGAFDELRIYQRALSASQVEQLYGSTERNAERKKESGAADSQDR